MADINKNSIPLTRDPMVPGNPPTSTPTGLSFSRRVKIGMVLLLMLFGYFLMEERPHPGSISTDSVGTSSLENGLEQNFVNDLAVVAREKSRSQLLPTVESTGIRLPTSVASDSAHQFAAKAIPNNPASRQPAYLEASPGAPVPTRIAVGSAVRFTGRIEPLR